MIVLDTSVLSLAFRRGKTGEEAPPAAHKLRALILNDQPLLVPGVVLQELLSGLRGESEFNRLEFLLRGFVLLLSTREHHLAAARIANACRQRGVITSATDSLIAAQAIAVDGWLLTTDADFGRIAQYCSLKLATI